MKTGPGLGLRLSRSKDRTGPDLQTLVEGTNVLHQEKPFCLKLPIGTLKASIDAKSVSTLKARLPANCTSKSTKGYFRLA